MEDIAPQLLKEIEDVFQSKVKNNKFISFFLKRMQNGQANVYDVNGFASNLGNILGETFVEVLNQDMLPDGKLYWNIAERTMIPMIEQNYELINEAGAGVQKIEDMKKGIGLKTIKAPKPTERIKGLIDNVTVDGLPFEEVQRRMKEPVVNISESFYDDFVKENARFRYKAGLQTQIIRVLKGKKPCKWCKSLAGVYDYSQVSDTGNDVFRRHENCHCQVVYVNHKHKYKQDVHTKK